MALTVNLWIVIGVLWLALFGVVFWWRVARGAVADAWDWWRRDRVAPLLEDDDCISDDCATGDHFACEGCWCTCGHAPLEELPPERSWEEMTADQPIVVDRVTLWGTGQERWGSGSLSAARERRAPWWEAEQRAAYESLGFDYPSGLMARVREAAP